MVNNEDKTTTEMLKTLIVTSDAPDQKLTNIKAEINEIKINLVNFKALQKEELTKIKKTVENVEESQDLINRKFEETGPTDKRPQKVICKKCRAML